MLNDEVIDKVIDRVVRRIEQGNTYVLKKMGESVRRLRTLTPTQAQQLAQIMRFGGDYDKIVRELAKISKLNIKDIQKIFEEVSKSNYQFASQFYKYRNKKFIPYEKNEALQKQVNAIAKLTANEYTNITNTMGFAVKEKGKIVYKTLAKTYQDLLDKAVLNVGQGKSTFDEEMYATIKELASSGLKTVDYASGRSIRLDSAVRNAMANGLRNLHMKTQQIFGEEFEADGVEISVHINPAPDHQYVQGKQFSNEEFEKFQNDEDAVSYDGTKFPAESEETGRDRRSIGEYNCYHYIFSIVLGVSEPEYTDDQLKKIIKDNNKGFKLDGKKYSLYQGTQLQRKIETAIRQQKDIQIMAKARGDADLVDEAQGKITILTRKYHELNKISGLKSQLERARVQGYRRTAISNVYPRTPNETEYYNDVTNEFLLSIGKNKKATITNAKEITINNKTYKVNKQNPIIHDFNEVPTAQFIQKKLHMNVEYLPNINEDKKVKLGDYKINSSELWELKTITSNNKNTIKDAIKKASHQAPIVLLDITYSDINMEKVLEDINDAFRQRKKIERIILKNQNNILKVLDKKRN